MRDFRDAKAMARSLRDALTAKSVQITHSESLELIAKAFGYDNWNILSARIEAAPPTPDWPGRLQKSVSSTERLHCSFCGKSQDEVEKLVAGPSVFICDKCVDLCSDIVDEQLLRLLEGDKQGARTMSTESLQHYALHAERGAQRNRQTLQCIERALALRGHAPADEASLPSGVAELKDKTQYELRTMQAYSQAQLKSYERALQTAMVIVGERMR